MKYLGKLDSEVKERLREEASKRYPLAEAEVPTSGKATVYFVIYSVVVAIFFIILIINEYSKEVPDDVLSYLWIFWGCFELAAIVLYLRDRIKKNNYVGGLVMKAVVTTTSYGKGTKKVSAVYYDYLSELYCCTFFLDDGIPALTYAKAGNYIYIVVKEKGNQLKVAGPKK